MNKQPKNVGQSVLDRLNRMAKERAITTDSLYLRYVAERFLYRLSISPYSASFILKGGNMFTVWHGQNYRATKDIDFLGYSVSNDLENIRNIFYAILTAELPVSDGITFLTDTLKVHEINKEADYRGVHVEVIAHIINYKTSLQIDIGFGDQVIPTFEEREYPSLLEFPSPMIYTYSIYSVISEKFHAMVILGIGNSRLKDFSDIYTIMRRFDIDGELLQQAIHTTFKQRHTELPTEIPTVFTSEYYGDQAKVTQWKNFSKKILSVHEVELPEVTHSLVLFLMPVVESIALNVVFTKRWDKDSQTWLSSEIVSQ